MAYEVKTRALGLAETVISVDPAALSGLCVAELEAITNRGSAPLPQGWKVGPGFPQRRKPHSLYDIRMTWLERRGQEYDTACAIIKTTHDGPVTLLAEAQFVGVNPSSTARIITSRARWCMAFELACADAGRPLTVHHVPPSTWQCEYLGLPANAGSNAMKLASALSAKHVLWRLTGERSDIEGDAADALCLNMWWLEHFLAPLPRKFKRS